MNKEEAERECEALWNSYYGEHTIYLSDIYDTYSMWADFDDLEGAGYSYSDIYEIIMRNIISAADEAATYVREFDG